jgi:hypothetical protein
MNAAATLDRSIEDLAAQCSVDAHTVQMAAEGVARRLVALFGGAEQAAGQMSDTSVRAALTHYTDSMRRCAEQAAADPSQIIALLLASK